MGHGNVCALVGLLGSLALVACRDDGGGGGGGTDTDPMSDDGDAGDDDADDDDDADGDSDGGEPEEIPDGVGPMGIRRLTVAEYDNTVLDLVGDDSRPAAAYLPEDKKLPFDNDFRIQSASRVLVEGAETLAGNIAVETIEDPARRDMVVGCTPAGDDDADCMSSFVASFGRRALRRPLSSDEASEFVELGLDYAAQGNDFFIGVEEVLRAMLQDAEFLYRVELGTPVAGQDGVFRLSDYEIATRMSYFAWGSTPNEALLDLAESGALSDEDDRRDAMQTLLADDRARRQVDRFHALWLGYHELPHTPDLGYAMRTETAALLDRVVFDEPSSWLDLFTTTETFVDDTLAAHYGLSWPGGSGAQWVDYGGTERQGILSHGAFLSVAGNPGDTSPTKRGKLIRNRLLCEVIPPPPPDAPADEPPDGEAGDCKVDRYAAHREPGACKACHDQMDPIGFGLENYDLAGRFREHDDGAPECIIEGEGELVGVGTFSGPAELSDLILDNGIDACVVEQLYIYAMGRRLETDDLPYLESLEGAFTDADHHFDALLLELVADPAFAYRREEQ